MVAPTGISAVCTAYGCKCVRDTVRLRNRLILVVKNIPRDNDQIGLHRVDRIDRPLDVRRIGTVPQMQVSKQGDRHVLALPGQCDIVIGHIQLAGMHHTIQADRAYQRKGNTALRTPHLLHLFKILAARPSDNKQRQFNHQHGQYQIQHPAKPIIADLQQRFAQRIRRPYQKAGQRRGCDERIQHDKHRAEGFCAEHAVACTRPAQHPTHQIQIDKNIERREKNRDHAPPSFPPVTGMPNVPIRG